MKSKIIFIFLFACIFLSVFKVEGQNTSLSFGSIKGNFEVTPTGASTYNISVECPAGIGNMQPQLFIRYNSQSANNILGYGVNLGGLSIISRTPQDFYHDNFSRQLSLDRNDRFALDGNRLICTKGSYGDPNSEYHTESESFSYIRANGNYNNNSTGPEFFEIQTKNGTKLYYGSSTGKIVYNSGSTNTIIGWYLDYQEDIYGNYISYTYEQNGLNLYIKTISYGLNKNTEAGVKSTIEFEYENRPDPIPVVICNQQGPISLRLLKITSKTGNSVFRQYDFAYNNSVYSNLATITENNGNGQKLNPTKFTWNSIKQQPELTSESRWDSFRNYSFVTADFNGDGITDLGRVNRGVNEDYMTIYYAKPSLDGTVSYYEAGLDWGFGTQLSYTDSNGKLIDNSNFVFPDIDGDGKSEYGIIYKQGSRFCINFYKERNIVAFTPFYDLSSDKPLLLSVFDKYHDGFDDVLYLEKEKKDNCYNGKILRFKENYSFFPVSFVVRDIENPQELFVLDMDKDGLEDLVIAAKNNIYIFKNNENTFSETPTYTIPTNVSDYRVFRYGDFNGDGLIDFIYLKANSNLEVAYNTGNYSSFNLVDLSNLAIRDDKDTPKDDDKDNLLVTDFNHDGKSDIITFEAAYDNWDHDLFTSWKTFTGFKINWYKSNGTGFESVISTISNQEQNAYKQLYFTGDFNGDGQQDLLNYGFNCVNGNASDAFRVYSTFNRGQGLINKITDGLGNYNIINYKSNSIFGVNSYQDQYDLLYDTYQFPLRYFGAPFDVVSSVTTSQGIANPVTTYYSFLKPASHYLKGFMGFGQIITNNSLTNEVSEKTYGFNYLKGTEHYYLPFATTSSLKIDNETLTVSDYWSELFNYTGNGYFFYQNTIHTKDFLSKKETYSYVMYDTDGNLKSTSESIYDLNDDNFFTKDVSYNQYADRINNDDNHLPNSPGEIVTSIFYDDGTAVPFETKTSLLYNSNGSIQSKIDFASKTTPVTTSYTYWPTGAIKSTVLSANGMDSRSVTNEYESSFRFINKVINALGDNVETNYNSWGLPNWTKDQNGLYTYFLYDNWGNLVSTKLPDKNKKNISVNWSNSIDGPSGALYFSQTSIDNENEPGEKFTGATYYDAAGHRLRDVTINSNGEKYYTDTKYNYNGQVTDITTPYRKGGNSKSVYEFYI